MHIRCAYTQKAVFLGDHESLTCVMGPVSWPSTLGVQPMNVYSEFLLIDICEPSHNFGQIVEANWETHTFSGHKPTKSHQVIKFSMFFLGIF